MKVKIQSTTTNALLGRTEIRFAVTDFAGTPARKELHEAIAAQTNTKPELLVIEKTRQGFGNKTLEGGAHAYHDSLAMKKLEPEHMMTRTFGKPAEKPAENKQGE